MKKVIAIFLFIQTVVVIDIIIFPPFG
ncbi:Predicted protein [Streptococcus thermophilus LMD-9]|nr:Predicted protein [Streptococcus thermophilus LMD-9]